MLGLPRVSRLQTNEATIFNEINCRRIGCQKMLLALNTTSDYGLE